jgi:peptide-methionine (R)-S-oxide reductase
MNRRTFNGALAAATALFSIPLTSCAEDKKTASSSVPLQKTEDEWRKLLRPDQFTVLRKEGTEPPNSSPLNNIEASGTFVCAGCFLPLFYTANKYDSGTGWPSFWRPLEETSIATRKDYKLILPRTEYHCSRCGGHQGHIFDDGPKPTGLRYCNNGLALKFVAEQETLPKLLT